MFFNEPKSVQEFGLLLWENFPPRTFKNRPIWSHWYLGTNRHQKFTSNESKRGFRHLRVSKKIDNLNERSLFRTNERMKAEKFFRIVVRIFFHSVSLSSISLPTKLRIRVTLLCNVCLRYVTLIPFLLLLPRHFLTEISRIRNPAFLYQSPSLSLFLSFHLTRSFFLSLPLSHYLSNINLLFISDCLPNIYISLSLSIFWWLS